MATLFELRDQFLGIWHEIQAIMPEDEHEAQALYQQVYADVVDDLKVDIVHKMQGYVHIIKRLGIEKDAAKKEKERVAAIEKVAAAKEERLKAAILFVMQELGVEDIKAGTFTVKVQNSPPSVGLVDEKFVPETYLVPQLPKVDKKALLDDLKSGVLQADGNIFIKYGRHLRIR